MNILEEMFGPDNTMYKFRRGVSDGATRECFLGWFWSAVVTTGEILQQTTTRFNINHTYSQFIPSLSQKDFYLF